MAAGTLTHRYVAATWCEFLTISRDDLSELFQRRPSVSRRFHEAVLRASVAKERMRRLGSKFLRKIEGLDPRVRAALVIQDAWDRFCASVAMGQHRRHFMPPPTTLRLADALASRAIAPPPPEGPLTSRAGPHAAGHQTLIQPSPSKGPRRGSSHLRGEGGGAWAAPAPAAHASGGGAATAAELAPLKAEARRLVDTLGGLTRGFETLQTDARGLVGVLGEIAAAHGMPQVPARGSTGDRRSRARFADQPVVEPTSPPHAFEA